MLLLDIIKRSSRSLLSARIRTLLTAFAIAVGAFALTLTLGASNGAQSYADTIVRSNFDPSELIVTADGDVFDAVSSDKPREYNPNFGTVAAAGGNIQVKMLTDNDISQLKSFSGVTSVQPLNSVSLQYLTRDGQRKYVATAQAYNSYTSPDFLAGTATNLANGTLILPEGFLPSLGFTSAADAIGKIVRLSVSKQADLSSLTESFQSGDISSLKANDAAETTFTIAAVNKKPSVLLQSSAALYVSVNQHDLTQLNDLATKDTANYHKYLSAFVKVRGGTDASALAAVQTRVKKAGYNAQSVADTEKTITQVINVLQGIVTVFGLIAVVASVFGVVNTMYISVLQRTREIGLMKALGMHKKDINRLFLFEAGFIGLLGGLLGTALATVVGTVLNPFISRQLDLGDTHLIQFKLGQLGLLIVALTLVAIAAGLFPARKAARLDPITALRTE